MRIRSANPSSPASFLLPALSTLIALTLFAATPARAEDIVLPYTCQMAGGRPTLIPSAPHPHRIVGQHIERRVTICSPADPGRCRAWTAHSFDMICGGVEVPWPAVVAGSPPARGGNAWIENGRFRLSMPPAWSLPTQDPCSRLIDDRDPELTRYCANRPAPAQPVYAEMPPGFAPMFGLNGTFTATSGPNIASNARPEAMLTPSPGATMNWRTSPMAPPKAPPPQPGETPLPNAIAKPNNSAPADLPPLKPAIAPQREAAPAAEPRSTTNAPLPPLPSRSIDAATPRAMAPLEQPKPVKPELKPEPKFDPSKLESLKAELPKPEPAKPEPVKPIAAAPAAAPTPTPAPTPPAPLAAPPVATPAPAPASTLPPAQSATAEPTTRAQVAETRATPEPYSSRPAKIASPDSDLRTGLMIFGGVALTLTLAGAALFLRRRRTSPDDPNDDRAAVDRDRAFAPPALNGPTHRTASARHEPGFHDNVQLPGLDAIPTTRTPNPATYRQSQDPFDRPMPGFDRPSRNPYDDGVRTHLDADPDPEFDDADTNGFSSEDAPIIARDLDPAFETLPTPSRDAPSTQTTLARTEQPLATPVISGGAGGWPTEMPQSRGDALYILGMGVTTRASVTAMKKIVDGLRMTWHPDQATDDADRAIRDLRIRQINTAWDIIQAHHTQPNDDPVI